MGTTGACSLFTEVDTPKDSLLLQAVQLLTDRLLKSERYCLRLTKDWLRSRLHLHHCKNIMAVLTKLNWLSQLQFSNAIHTITHNYPVMI